MNYKQLKDSQTEMPTLQEVVEEKADWVKVHTPEDKSTILGLFQFVVNEGSGGALVPLDRRLSIPAVDLRPHAMDQLLARLDFNKRLYQRLPGKMNLLAINWLIQNERERQALLRIQDGDQCRALLSGQYETFDTLQLLQELVPLCGGAKVRVAYDDELTFHLSLTFPNTATEVKRGDILESGIHISNSEVGLRSVTVAGYVYRLVCSNGIISHGNGDGGMFRFRHTGDGDNLRDRVRSAVESTFLDAQKITAQFQNALNIAITDPATRLQQVVEDNNLSKDDYKAMLDRFMEEPEQNLFGVVNAITAAARDEEGEKSYELQRIAAKTLSRS